jgi:hypothetical protein
VLDTIPMQVGAIAALIGGAIGICGFIYTIYKIATRVEAAIGVDEKGRTISDRMERVEYQLWENGGESLADRVNEIDKNSRETAVEVRFIKEILVQNMGNISSPQVTKQRRSKKSVA